MFISISTLKKYKTAHFLHYFSLLLQIKLTHDNYIPKLKQLHMIKITGILCYFFLIFSALYFNFQITLSFSFFWRQLKLQYILKVPNVLQKQRIKLISISATHMHLQKPDLCYSKYYSVV